MLRIVDLKKDYTVAGEPVHALKGISVNFRRSEFVSILGPSGCGKTTFLNIIGGLDKYTSGDLQIEGKSTKTYSDRDWDTYRNHSIGFIFQSYHLIPHQSILQNVELALMIAGISKKERRQRAIDALDKVGLKDKIHNKPNQLSGGQAQRVAIARALINDPEIVLADEPTGALDSVTSVQIMELLKEISKDRLVVMVTHNPELAEQYSTRIVRLKDGEVVDDTNPYSDSEEMAERVVAFDEQDIADGFADVVEETALSEQTEGHGEGGNPQKVEKVKKTNKGKKHSAMSIGMAFGLSFKNLLSKRKRTAMVSFAGSIGIIGVSMVLAISSGVQGYITSMQNDMLSGYPVSVTQSAYDFTSLMELSGGQMVDVNKVAQGDKVYVNSLLDTLGTFSTGFEKTNTITEEYLAYVNDMPDEYVNLIQYGYDFKISNNIYTDFEVSDDLASHLGYLQDVDGYENKYNMSVTAIRAMYSAVLTHVPEYATWGSMISTVSTFEEMPDNFDYIMSQYDVLAVDQNGKAVTTGYTQAELKEIFNSKESLIMVLNHNQMDDLTLAQYGYFKEDEFLEYAYSGVDENKGLESEDGEEQESTLIGSDGFEYSKFVGDSAKKFTYYPNDCVYNLVEYSSFMTDEEIRADADYGAYADYIIAARNQGDEQLKALIDGMVEQMVASNPSMATYADVIKESMYQDLRLPTADEVTEGYVANAYSTEYTFKDSTGAQKTLPAFSSKSGYDKRVEMGVKLILQKKDSVSYGCLQSGFYHTKALTDYVLETEKDSEIVEYINENGVLEKLPMYVDYYYVATSTDAEYEEGKDYYKFVSGKECSIETGGTMMQSMIGSMTGSTSSQITAALLGGDDMPTAVYVYPVDFEYKNKVCEYLDAWNDICTEKTVITYEDGSVKKTIGLTMSDGTIINGGKVTLSDGTQILGGKVIMPDGFTFTASSQNLPSGVTVSGGVITLANGVKVHNGTVTLTNKTVITTPIITLSDGTVIGGLGEKDKITYTDTVGLIINMVNTMINMITIALIVFTALSLVVSTVMIGIITYVSVVERVKEIGILRAVGARKKDIKRLFNAETLMIGLAAGVFGILITYLLSLITNIIVSALAGIWGIAALPWWQALIMIGLSVALTLISGLIPASAAAKKDPVVALRTE
ncbi:MAG: ATP-binding cassette domain-containing protein [Candidatus Coproplasma sp.]